MFSRLPGPGNGKCMCVPLIVKLLAVALYLMFKPIFNPTTRIEFGIPAAAHVRLTVHDVAGRRVTVLADAPHQAGVFTKAWDGRDKAGREVGSGIYFARMVAGEFTAVRKMVFVK